MKNWTDEELEKFIRENKDALVDGCRPIVGHEIKFMTKLQLRVKHYIDITPYLVKVGVVTLIIFLCSVFAWYSFMRPDPNKSVIKNIIEQFEKKK
jgi:hypothetical protein